MHGGERRDPMGVALLALRGSPHRASDQGQRAGGRGGLPLLFHCSTHSVSLGVCHPGWEAEQQRTDWQTTDSEDRKQGGAAPNVRALGPQMWEEPVAE